MTKNVNSKTVTVSREADGFYDSRPPGDTTPPVFSGTVGLVATGTNSLRVTYPAASDLQSAIARYEIQLAKMPEGVFVAAGDGDASLVLNIDNLQTATPYVARVRPWDASGNDGPWLTSQEASTLTPTSEEAYPLRGAYLQGTTDWQNCHRVTDSEVIRRSRNRVLISTGPYSVAPSFGPYLANYMMSLRALNPLIEIYWYSNGSEWRTNWTAYQASPANGMRPPGVFGEVFDLLTANGWWANTPYNAGWDALAPNGTNDPNFLSGTNWQCNQTLSNKDAGGLYWCERLRKYILDDMSMGTYGSDSDQYFPAGTAVAKLGTFPIAGMMADNSQNRAYDNYDFNRDGSNDSAEGAPMRAAWIANHHQLHNFLNARGLKYICNGTRDWAINYYNVLSQAEGDAARSAMANMCDGVIVEMIVGLANSAGRVFYWNRNATLGTAERPSSFGNFRTYPAGGTISSEPAHGDLVQNTYSGWTTSQGGTNLYNLPRPSVGKASSLRALMEFYEFGSEYTNKKLVIWQTFGPPPSRIGTWTNVDRHIRNCVLAPVALMTGGRPHYTMMETSPSRVGYMSEIDELAFDYGQPENSELGKPGLRANHGAGVGNGYQNGVYVRKFVGGTYGDTLVIVNMVGNGQQTITLPPGNWYRFNASRHLNQAPSTNTGAAQSSSLVIPEHDGLVLVTNP